MSSSDPSGYNLLYQNITTPDYPNEGRSFMSVCITGPTIKSPLTTVYLAKSIIQAFILRKSIMSAYTIAAMTNI